MGKVLDANYEQVYVFPPSIENWVVNDDPVRFIREFVDLVRSKGEVFREVPADQGRPAYSVWLLLKIWLYAYLKRIRSTREVERSCRELLPMIWLAGGLQPDHNTLWRFWKDNQELVGTMFRESVKLAIELKMVSFALHAVDGTKLGAAGSTHCVLSQEQVEKKLARVGEQIKAIEQQIEEASQSEEKTSLGKLPEQLRDRKRLRARMEKALENRSDKTGKRHPEESEARLMKKVGLGYNGQTVVDEKAHIIVANDLSNQTNDCHQLMPMLDKVHETYDRVADETVADGGYNTAEAIGQASEKDYPVIVGKPGKNAKSKYHTSKFRYDEEQDVVICPESQLLTFERETKRKRQPYTVRIYRSSVCHQCPARSACTKDRRGRMIEISPYHRAVEQHREKREQPAMQQLYARRFTLGERDFAEIKIRFGFRRFRMQGLTASRLEWSFVCAVYNLKELLHRVWQPGLLA